MHELFVSCRRRERDGCGPPLLWRGKRNAPGTDTARRGGGGGGKMEAGEYDVCWPHAFRGHHFRQGRRSRGSWCRAYGEEEAGRSPAGQPLEAITGKEKAGWPPEEETG